MKQSRKGDAALGAFGQYAKINPILIEFKDEEWKQLIEKNRSDRDSHQSDGQNITFGQIAARFLGIPRDEDEYYSTLFQLSQKANVEVWNGSLSKEIAPQRFQALQNVLQINQGDELSVNRFVAFLEGGQLIPSHEDASIHRHIRESLIAVLNAFKDRHSAGLKSPEFRRVITDLVKWMWNHIDGILSEMGDGPVPCILWYGEATESERYLLYFVTTLGLDVLIFHPGGLDIMKDFDQDGSWMIVQEYPQKQEPRPFPTSMPVRKATVAYQASKEIERILHTEETPILKAWQYRSHIPVSITLKTTYDELFLMSREKAFIRPNFKVEGNEVHIPSLFAKVAGVPANRREYWDKIDVLKENGESLFIRYFPFTNPVRANHKYHYDYALGPNGTLDPVKMTESVWWQLKQLPNGVQLAIASAISRVCARPKLLPENRESENDVRLYLFTQLTVIPKSVITLFLKFDYPQEVPRLVIYNSGSGGGITRSDAALLLLLNELGLDIILFNPSGLKDLELFIDERYYDIHLMDQFEFDYEYQERKVPIWRRLFKKET